MSVIRRHQMRWMLGVCFSRYQLDRILGRVVVRQTQSSPTRH